MVNNGKLLIADFGLSKQLAEVTSNSIGNMMGIIEYIDPQCYKDLNYKRGKKADIYSLGVLFWEITSGQPPFHNFSQNVVEQNRLCFHISYEDYREEPIKGTPLEYQQLYQECWDGSPEKRPDINQVYDKILSQSNVNHINGQQDELDDSSVASNSNNLNKQSNQSDLYINSDQYVE